MALVQSRYLHSHGLRRPKSFIPYTWLALIGHNPCNFSTLSTFLLLPITLSHEINSTTPKMEAALCFETSKRCVKSEDCHLSNTNGFKHGNMYKVIVSDIYDTSGIWPVCRFCVYGLLCSNNTLELMFRMVSWVLSSTFLDMTGGTKYMSQPSPWTPLPPDQPPLCPYISSAREVLYHCQVGNTAQSTSIISYRS